jgi:hypothetical protein
VAQLPHSPQWFLWLRPGRVLPLGLLFRWQPAPDLLAQAVGFYLDGVS